MQWSTKHCGLGKGCTCLLLFVLMPEVELGEEAREGKEGKGAGRRSAIDLPIAGRSHNNYLCHLSQMCLVIYPCYGYDKKHTPLWLAWQHKQTTSLRELCSTDIFCCILVSNVTILVISYLLFPVTGHSVYCFFYCIS